jgi:O-antigen ligase
VQIGLTVSRRRLPFRPDWLAAAMLAWLGVGAVYIAVGLARGFGLASLRDGAISYYAVFVLFALGLVRTREQVGTLALLYVVGASAGAIVATGKFLLWPELSWGHGTSGQQAVAAWLAILVLLIPRPDATARWRRVFTGLAVVGCSASVYLCAMRSVLIAAAASLVPVLMFMLARPHLRWRRYLGRLTAWLVAFGVVVLLMRLLFGLPGKAVRVDGPVSLRDGVGVITARWFNRGLDSSYDFRSEAWRRALARIRSAPLVGIGFGPDPRLYPDANCESPTSPTSNCGNAHNTYLTLAMRLGVPIAAALLATIMAAGVRGYRRSVAHDLHGEGAIAAGVLTAAVTSMGAYGMFNLLFESPYLSTLAWVALGLLHAVAGGRPDGEGAP